MNRKEFMIKFLFDFLLIIFLAHERRYVLNSSTSTPNK